VVTRTITLCPGTLASSLSPTLSGTLYSRFYQQGTRPCSLHGYSHHHSRQTPARTTLPYALLGSLLQGHQHSTRPGLLSPTLSRSLTLPHSRSTGSHSLSRSLSRSLLPSLLSLSLHALSLSLSLTLLSSALGQGGRHTLRRARAKTDSGLWKCNSQVLRFTFGQAVTTGSLAPFLAPQGLQGAERVRNGAKNGAKKRAPTWVTVQFYFNDITANVVGELYAQHRHGAVADLHYALPIVKVNDTAMVPSCSCAMPTRHPHRRGRGSSPQP
jgi:hypothetical protein